MKGEPVTGYRIDKYNLVFVVLRYYINVLDHR